MSEFSNSSEDSDSHVNIWVHHEDGQGRSYFYNTITKTSIWELPLGPNEWLECKDPNTGKAFFHNAEKDISLWEDPREQDSRDWMECIDTNSGRTFYYNVKQSKSMWTKPKEKAAKTNEVAEEEEEEEEEEMKRSDSINSQIFDVVPDGEYHDYVLKEGGGTSMFGRKNWKKRFLVLKQGEIGWFKSFKDYASGALPLKGRWTSLSGYRLEESLSEEHGVRLLPLNADVRERIWNLRCDDEKKKAKLMEAMASCVVAKGFVKHLDKELSGRRFLTGI